MKFFSFCFPHSSTEETLLWANSSSSETMHNCNYHGYRLSLLPKHETGGPFRSYVAMQKDHHKRRFPKNLVIRKHHLRWRETDSTSLRGDCRRQSSPSEALLTSGSQDASSRLLVDGENVGVLLLNLGGPETLDDVQPFLFNLFSDPVINENAFL